MMTPRSVSCKEALESNSKCKIYEGEIGCAPIACSNMQCTNGHTMCATATCQGGSKCCTACCFELGKIRCFALDKVAESLELPCRYQSLGCLDMFPYHSKLKHEKHCSFRPYNCPYASSECSVTGNIPFVVAHLKKDHSADMHNGCNFSHTYVESYPHQMKTATWMLTVINCFGRHFCLHFESFVFGSAPFYMTFLRFMGEDSEAKNFSYTLEVGAFRRKLVWQGVPRSIRDSHKKVGDSQDGLIIPMSLALHFSAGDGQLKLPVTGRIWRI